MENDYWQYTPNPASLQSQQPVNRIFHTGISDKSEGHLPTRDFVVCNACGSVISRYLQEQHDAFHQDLEILVKQTLRNEMYREMGSNDD